MKDFRSRLVRDSIPAAENDKASSFECEYFKPDNCDPATSPCPQTEDCAVVHDPRHIAGMKHACYAAWTNDTVNGVRVKLKGCWLAQDVEPFDCGNSECVADSPASLAFKNEANGPMAYFCCCNKPKCNQRFEYRPSPSTVSPKNKEVTTTPSPNTTDVTASLVYAFAPICVLALLIIMFYWIYRRYKLKRAVKRLAKDGKLPFPPKIPPSPTDASKTIELIEIVSKGRYGCVWKARDRDQVIAVKVFPAQDVDSWVQEQEIYNTPGMKHHPNILRYLGAECRGNGSVQTEYWLISAYQEHGSLHDYLKRHTLSVSEVLQISTSMLRGLAYLHEESSLVNDQQSFKPTIVHRDFKSRNVLLKNGLTACIADFGLALKCVQGRTPNAVHSQVGTRRYMAPEVLEGATEFSAFAFRQIDVYAAGLVVWEVVSRCSFSSEDKVGDYRLPFEEIGTRPTLEELQDHVVVKKQRPPIKSIWRQNAHGVVICSTMEEMWDSEPEARVTAGCAFERFSALQTNVQTNLSASSLNSNENGLGFGLGLSQSHSGMMTTVSEKSETAPLIVSDHPTILAETKIV